MWLALIPSELIKVEAVIRVRVRAGIGLARTS